MNRVELQNTPHDRKIGDECVQITPNVSEDCLFVHNGEAIGFFLKRMPENMCKIANAANAELLSKNVPKSAMNRMTTKGYDENGKGIYERIVQHSVILGGVPAKPHMRRPYNSISSVHSVASAKKFIKLMLALSLESEKLIKNILPEQHERQIELFKNVDPKYKFGNIFTSSISNFNISANYHIDRANIKNTVNVIITKRENSVGGNLNVPDYGATIDQCDNSILVYPAWRDMHGVTPIEPTKQGGYRNSLVFYPLSAFNLK